MARNIEGIKKELKKRGFKDIVKEDINSWALVFALEDVAKEMKKPFVVNGLKIKQ